MGVGCSDERDKYLGYGFTIQELTKMKQIFTQISKEKTKYICSLKIPSHVYLDLKAKRP